MVALRPSHNSGRPSKTFARLRLRRDHFDSVCDHFAHYSGRTATLLKKGPRQLWLDPVDPVDPLDAVDPGDPVDPVDAVDPLDAMDPGDPVDPVDAVDPLDAMDPVTMRRCAIGVDIQLVARMTVQNLYSHDRHRHDLCRRRVGRRHAIVDD